MKRKPAKRKGEELGIPWEKFADGMPHRLKRNRDFPDVDLDKVGQAAKNAAARMDKALKFLPDRTARNKGKFVWVLFADYQLDVGEPCKCGGRRILRFHQFFGRCAACNALILLTSPDANVTKKGKRKRGDSGPKDMYGWEESTYGW